MKNWKKLLACLLVSLMALTVFTACDASVGAPMEAKSSDAESESVKALCDHFKNCEHFKNMDYSEKLSEKAYYVACWVASYPGSCNVNPEKTELSWEGNIGNDAKALLQMENPRYADAFDLMGIGRGIGGGMANNDFVPGFYFDTNLDTNGTSRIIFVLPKDGSYPEAMTTAAKGKSKLGVAYVVDQGVSYAVVLFGE